VCKELKERKRIQKISERAGPVSTSATQTYSGHFEKKIIVQTWLDFTEKLYRDGKDTHQACLIKLQRII
jgi:hypothetical protein